MLVFERCLEFKFVYETNVSFVYSISELAYV